MPPATVRLLTACSLLLAVAVSACTGQSRSVPSGSSLIADASDRTSTAAQGSPRRFIAHTEGRGVGLRTECRDDAVTQGMLAEAAEVIVDAAGSGPCAGWSRVHNGPVVSWVRNGYLAESPPSAATGASPGASAGASAGASTAAPPPGTSVASGVNVVVPNATPAPSSFVFTATGGATVSLSEIDGSATIWGGPSGLVYLGLVASTPLPDSVCNATGRHGSPSATDSIRNPASAYGSATGDMSAYSPAATAPPVIKHRNATIAVLTRASTARGALDPDVFLNALCR